MVKYLIFPYRQKKISIHNCLVVLLLQLAQKQLHGITLMSTTHALLLGC